MVSPACRSRVLGLGGASDSTGSLARAVVGRVFCLTGSVGATTFAGAGFGAATGGGAGSSGGSSTILRFRGAESSEPFGLPRPRFITANSCEFSELSGNSCEFSEFSAIYHCATKNSSDCQHERNVRQVLQNGVVPRTQLKIQRGGCHGGHVQPDVVGHGSLQNRSKISVANRCHDRIRGTTWSKRVL